MKREDVTLSPEAKEAQREYMRKWRKKTGTKSGNTRQDIGKKKLKITTKIITIRAKNEVNERLSQGDNGQINRCRE